MNAEKKMKILKMLRDLQDDAKDASSKMIGEQDDVEIQRIVRGITETGAMIVDELEDRSVLARGSRTKKVRKALGYTHS